MTSPFFNSSRRGLAFTTKTPSQRSRRRPHDVMPRRAAEPAADARTWPPACQSAHGRPPERLRRHWCCGDDGSYKNNTATPACAKTALRLCATMQQWRTAAGHRRMCPSDFASLRIMVVQPTWLVPAVGRRSWSCCACGRARRLAEKTLANFLRTVLVPSVSFFDHSNACAARRVSVGRDVLSVSTAHARVPRR